MLAHLLAIALAATQSDTVVARVAREPITAGEVMGHAHDRHIQAEPALEELVKEALLAVAARTDGLGSRPEVRARIASERRRLAAERLLQLEVLDRVTVTDREVADAYHARADSVRFSMVVKATEQEARDVLQRLRDGAALIDEAKSSVDPVVRSKSGVLGWSTRNELEAALAKQAFEAPLNQVSGPVPVKQGFAVFVVHERNIGSDAALLREAPQIRGAILNARRDDRAARFLKELRRSAPDAGSDSDTIAGEALRRGLDRDRAVVHALHRSERSILARAYVDRIATRVVAPDDAELESAYRARSDDFWVPQRRSCDILLARTESQAEQLRTRLVAGEALAAVAKDSAEVGTNEPSGGSIEVTDPQLDEMASDQSDQHVLAWTIRKTPPGIWTKVEARQHWHVIRCGTPEPRHRRSFSEARPELARSLHDQRLSAELDRRIAQLRRVTPVRIDDRALHASARR